MKRNPTPTTKYLNECFTYEPIAGDLFWRERPLAHFGSRRGQSIFNTKYAGRKAGGEHYQVSGQPGAIMIRVNGFKMCAHVIIHGLMGLDIPMGFIVDHKDTNPFNNRWNNLRLATHSQNAMNRRGKAGRKFPKGVSPWLNSFRAGIQFGGRQISLGCFPTVEQAHHAYCAKAKELFGDFARFN